MSSFRKYSFFPHFQLIVSLLLLLTTIGCGQKRDGILDSEADLVEIGSGIGSNPRISKEVEPKGSEKKAPSINPALESAYSRLVQGEFFHNIPEEFKVGEPKKVEAGVSEEVNRDLLDSLGIDGPVSVEESAIFDPLRAELLLSGDPEAFLIKEISGGKKTVLSKASDHWQWSVTPLKRGQHSLKIESVITLEGDNPFPPEIVVLTERNVAVEGTTLYTIESALSEYSLLFLFIFLLPIFSLTAWLIMSSYYQKQSLLTIAKAPKVREEDL